MIRTIPVTGTKGYGSSGASTTKRALKGFRAVSGSPHEDIDLNNYTLRQRGRLMYMGAPIATSAVKTSRTNIVGLGLQLNPRPDLEFLGLDPDKAEEWTKTVKREFSLWADSKDTCDATGINNFYELQQLLMSSWLMSGDVFVLIQERDPVPGKPYRLRLRTVEADRVATPDQSEGYIPTVLTTGVNPKNGNTIYDGVEVDKSGMVVAYHIRNTYPYEATIKQTEFVRVEARGKTGLPNVIQIMNAERPDQYRGVTFLAPVIEKLLQINRYTEAEITAAIVQSYLTGFVTKNGDASENPFNEVGAGFPEEEVSRDSNDYEMGPGTINYMEIGENINFTNPTHPSTSFDAFTNSIVTQIGAALDMPKEILTKAFTSSYSASRGALLEAWKSFKMYRTWFVNDFCNPVYELWLNEAIASGRVEAPGYFSDPAVRAAWLKCEWIGPSQGMLDPTKEIQAEQMACENGFSTHTDSALRLNGSDYDSNIERLAMEADKVKECMGSAEPEEPDPDPEEEQPVTGMSKKDAKEMIKLLTDIKRNQIIYAPDN